MSAVAEQLKPMLIALSTEDRQEIMAFLAGLNGNDEPNPADDALFAELERRRAEHESGRDPGVSADELFRRLENRAC